MNRSSGRHALLHAWLVLISALSLYYLYRGVDFRFLQEYRLGPTLLDKQLWYVGHVVLALPVLLGAPLQFLPRLRQRAPHVHRWVGRAYVYGALGAGVFAVYLGATIEYEGSRLAIVLGGLLWLFFTVVAWRAAVAGDYATHRAFMIRSYALALVLVWLRLMYDLQDYLFFYVEDEAMRDVTREWASWVVPLLAVELWLSWWPQVRARRASAPARARTHAAR